MIKRRACQGLWEALFYIVAQAVKTWNAIDAAFKLISLIHDWMPYHLYCASEFLEWGFWNYERHQPKTIWRKYTYLMPHADFYRKWVDTADCCPLLISSIPISWPWIGSGCIYQGHLLLLPSPSQSILSREATYRTTEYHVWGWPRESVCQTLEGSFDQLTELLMVFSHPQHRLCRTDHLRDNLTVTHLVFISTKYSFTRLAEVSEATIPTPSISTLKELFLGTGGWVFQGQGQYGCWRGCHPTHIKNNL